MCKTADKVEVRLFVLADIVFVSLNAGFNSNCTLASAHNFLTTFPMVVSFHENQLCAVSIL